MGDDLTFSVQCIQCGGHGIVEVYFGDFEGIALDTTKALCFGCKAEMDPAEYYDQQCAKCGQWSFRREDSGYKVRTGTWWCTECVHKVLQRSDLAAE